MKSLFAGLTVTALVLMTGCTEGTRGGPGATEVTANKPIVGQTDNTFSLDVPQMSTKLKQGETKELAIDVARGKNFSEDVELRFSGVPKGVTVDPASPVIMHSDKEAKITVKVADDAALGDFTVKVTGHPTSGADATNEFKMTVAKK
jgi:uncharacterized membrane protein